MGDSKRVAIMLQALILILAAAGAHAGNATTADWWITANGGTIPITTAEIGVDLNVSTVTLDVWYSTDGDHAAVSTFFAWDTTDTGWPGSGDTIQNKLTGQVATGIDTVLWHRTDVNKNLLVGARGSNPFPYGNYVSLNALYGSNPAPATTATRLFSVTLTNIGLAAGESFDVFLYNAPGPVTPGGDTYLTSTSSLKISPTWASKPVRITAGLAVASTVLAARSIPDGGLADLREVVVTGVFSGGFWIESSDRLAGIYVESAYPAALGQSLDVSGTVGTAAGRRTLLADSVQVSVQPQTAVRPLAAPAESLNAQCFPNGVLVTTWGQVTSDQGAGYFTINDGSLASPVKVSSGSLTRPAAGAFVVLTGIASTEGSPSGLVVIPRMQSDISVP